MVNQESKKGFLSRGVPRIERILDASLLHALFSCRLKFIAGNPPCQRRLPCRLRSEHEREPGDDRIAGKIHVRTVLVARLVITVLGKIFCLLLAPLRGVSRVLDAFIDRKRRHAHARQAEMIPIGGTSSKFKSTMIFPGGTGECFPKYSDPSSPCSSAVTDANKIDRGAATGMAPHTRASSSRIPQPVALSFAPL